LNEAGQEAFLVLTDVQYNLRPRVNSRLRTPILTQEQVTGHFLAKRNAIVIYSETVSGNPLKAKNVVRYLLNYAGALGGSELFQKEEYVVSFSKNILSSYLIS
jgi:hypothetical protein